jgi:hypothetical protein
MDEFKNKVKNLFINKDLQKEYINIIKNLILETDENKITTLMEDIEVFKYNIK